MSKNLFKPTKVGRYELKHRIAFPPLTRVRADDDHSPTPMMAEYYGQRSQAPGTLLITEATFIAPQASGYNNIPGIWTPEHIKGWKSVAQAVHDNKSVLFMQLWAVGRQAEPQVIEAAGYDYVSASAVKMRDEEVTLGKLKAMVAGVDKKNPVPRALTTEEVKEYVQLYAQAAKNAIEAGCDGVEIHGANGYLIDQFLRDNVNQRTDEYGGSIENRARFLLEIVDACVEAIGADRVGVRLSPFTEFGDVRSEISPLPQFSYAIAELEKRGLAGKRLAYLHTVEAVEMMTTQMSDKVLEQSNFVGQIWTGPWVRTGNLIGVAEKVADRDDRTIVGIGRYFIANPDLVEKLKEKKELTKYDRNTFYWFNNFDKPKGYIDY